VIEASLHIDLPHGAADPFRLHRREVQSMTQLPLIHLNGTSGRVLVREYADALDAVDKAIAAVGNVTVHGRDYYLIGERAATDASTEHHQRLRKLSDVRAEPHLIYSSVLEQTIELQTDQVVSS
jgi:hypothetical protein